MSEAGSLNNTRAFTLVELGLVLLLLSLFGLLSLPALDSYRQDALDQSARRLTSLAHHLFNEAALTGARHRLWFDLDGQNYRAERLQDSGEWLRLDGRLGGGTWPAGVRLCELRIEEQGSLTRGTATVEFLPQGYLPATTLYLQQEGDRLLSLHLEPLSAQGLIREGHHVFD